jgi:hypothetical protein
VGETGPGPQPPPGLIAEVTKRAGLIWIAIPGQDRPRPAWHVWRAGPLAPGAAYVVTGPGEQPLPGLAGAGRVTVIVAGGQTAGGRVEWTAAVGRVEPGSREWDEVIGPLVAGRLNAVLVEGETSPARRWATSGAVFRLVPVLDAPRDRGPDDTAAPNSRILLSAAPLSVHPDRRLAGHRQRRHSRQCCHSHQRGGFLMHRPYRSLLAVAAAGGLCLAGGMAAAPPPSAPLRRTSPPAPPHPSSISW